MDSCQLSYAVAQDEIISRHFLGVFPADQVPNSNSVGSLIANTDVSGSPGEHWVAMYKDSSGQEFFDSFGRRVFQNAFIVGPYRRNNTALQSPNAACCGEYCLYYLYHRVRELSLRDIIKQLKQSDQHPDSIVTAFVAQHFDLSPRQSAMCCIPPSLWQST